MEDNKIVHRQEAMALGLTRYFTGKPCKRGHVCQRHVSNLRCVVCQNAMRSKPDEQTLVKNRERCRRWRGNAENSEKQKAYLKAYYIANRERLNEAAKRNRKDWADLPPHRKETKRASNRKRKAIKRGAEGHHTAQDIATILAAQKRRCAYCKVRFVGRKFHVDHILALSKGGSNWPSNLQLLCPSCNQRKSDKDAVEFARSAGLLL